MATADLLGAFAVPRNPRRGLFLMMLGIALFSILNAVVKAQSELFPINQIIFFRNFFALFPLAHLLMLVGGAGLLRSTKYPRQTALSVLFTLTLVCLFQAYSIMPLADVTAIAFTQPLIVTALSAFLGAERAAPLQWLAVAIGLGGVFLMVEPTGNGNVLGVGLALAGSACGACSMLLQRSLSLTDSSQSIAIYTLGISALITAPTLFFSWVTPTLPQLAGLVAMGIASGYFQFLTVRAFYHAAPSAIAPVTYSKMFWALLIGLFWFGDIPTSRMLLGGGIVILATAIGIRSSSRGRSALTKI